jgi:hypothetical protein
VVIDPFSDNCTVVTGSHNLGFRASHNNDDNLVVIRGHRGLAEGYACHVLDIYDHYAWRYWLKEYPKDFGKPLETDDKWQARYILRPNVKSPELRFWLAAAGAGVAGAAARPASSTKRASKRAGSGQTPAAARPRSARGGARWPHEKKQVIGNRAQSRRLGRNPRLVLARLAQHIAAAPHRFDVVLAA